MTHFINYSPDTGLSISTFRGAEGYANGDITGLVEDIRAGRPGNCPLDGALDALEDGSTWSDEDQSIIEEIHASVREHEEAAH